MTSHGAMRSAWAPGHTSHQHPGSVINRWQAAPSPRALGGGVNTEATLSPLRAAVAAAAAGGAGGWGVQGGARQYTAGQEAVRTSWGSGPLGSGVPAGEPLLLGCEGLFLSEGLLLSERLCWLSMRLILHSFCSALFCCVVVLLCGCSALLCAAVRCHLSCHRGRVTWLSPSSCPPVLVSAAAGRPTSTAASTGPSAAAAGAPSGWRGVSLSVEVPAGAGSGVSPRSAAAGVLPIGQCVQCTHCACTVGNCSYEKTSVCACIVCVDLLSPVEYTKGSEALAGAEYPKGVGCGATQGCYRMNSQHACNRTACRSHCSTGWPTRTCPASSGTHRCRRDAGTPKEPCDGAVGGHGAFSGCLRMFVWT
jgi:hypothetical protein